MKRKKEGIDRNEEGKRQSEINLGCVEEKWACQSNDAGPDACAGIRSFKSLSPASIKVCSIKKKGKTHGETLRDRPEGGHRWKPVASAPFVLYCLMLASYRWLLSKRRKHVWRVPPVGDFYPTSQSNYRNRFPVARRCAGFFFLSLPLVCWASSTSIGNRPVH